MGGMHTCPHAHGGGRDALKMLAGTPVFPVQLSSVLRQLKAALKTWAIALLFCFIFVLFGFVSDRVSL